jgi:hypothetical protein
MLHPAGSSNSSQSHAQAGPGFGDSPGKLTKFRGFEPEAFEHLRVRLSEARLEAMFNKETLARWVSPYWRRGC